MGTIERTIERELATIKEMLQSEKIEVLNVQKVCEMTGYKPGYIYNLVSSGKIPCFKRGRAGRLFFNKCDVLAWLHGVNDEVLKSQTMKHCVSKEMKGGDVC